MPDLLSQSILCPVLIGRDAQVAALSRLLDQARAGQGQVALISGEAGIGKSRLVQEAKALAVLADFIILQGNCFETESNLPYAPLFDLLASLNDEKGLPAELNRRFFDTTTVLDGDPTQTRHRLFETLTTFLLTLVQDKCLLLIIEDVHWYDDLSCEFLLYFVRRIPNQPVLALLTYRDNEVNPILLHIIQGAIVCQSNRKSPPSSTLGKGPNSTSSVTPSRSCSAAPKPTAMAICSR